MKIKHQIGSIIRGNLNQLFILFHLLKHVNLLKTIYWNFRLFPFKYAKKLPIYLGYNVDMVGVHRGNITLNSQDIQRGMVKLGISYYPTFPAKGLHTLVRLGCNCAITLGNDVLIDKGCSLVASYRGNIIFGNGIYVNQHTMFYSNEKINIGNNVSIGWKCQLYDTPVHFTIDTRSGNIINPLKPIEIGDNAWLANHVTLVAGAKIPPFAIVGSHSLVNKDFSDNPNPGALIVGTPAKLIEKGRVRLLNEKVQDIIKSRYFTSSETTAINISDLGFDLQPIDGNRNLLYRR